MCQWSYSGVESFESKIRRNDKFRSHRRLTNLLRYGDVFNRSVDIGNICQTDSPLERWRPKENCLFMFRKVRRVYPYPFIFSFDLERHISTHQIVIGIFLLVFGPAGWSQSARSRLPNVCAPAIPPPLPLQTNSLSAQIDCSVWTLLPSRLFHFSATSIWTTHTTRIWSFQRHTPLSHAHIRTPFSITSSGSSSAFTITPHSSTNSHGHARYVSVIVLH